MKGLIKLITLQFIFIPRELSDGEDVLLVRSESGKACMIYDQTSVNVLSEFYLLVGKVQAAFFPTRYQHFVIV